MFIWIKIRNETRLLGAWKHFLNHLLLEIPKWQRQQPVPWPMFLVWISLEKTKIRQQIRNQHRQVSLAGSSPSPSGVSSQTKWNSRVFRRQNQLAIVADDERQTKITHHFEFMDTLSHLKKQNKELSDALKAMNARMEPLKQQTDANKPKEGT